MGGRSSTRKRRESEILKAGGLCFLRPLPELLPEMIMEIDTRVNVTFMNTQG
ncbi:MAG: hypothetical protein U5L72_20105 [Bacteroidales bacterium]|nr:hypothetical protein [Bacteroidales bacterium]